MSPSLSAFASILAFSLLALTPPIASSQTAGRQDLVAAMDSAAQAHVENEMVAGVSVAVVRGADTLLFRGYGMADLEWDIPTPEGAGASYEIGSMTKQFTAVAILQLVEEGKLDLGVDFTEYLPSFDAGERVVTLARLLDHTSGIKAYTAMPMFGEFSMMALPRDSLVSLVEAEPFDFEPGNALIYNNSGYFLLGLIIEAVSGQSYEEYVAEHLFEPNGMEGSYYCSEVAIRKKRAHGYDGSPQGLNRKNYLNHTWPYAAGSLCSTVGDLVKWNQALHGNGILPSAAYNSLITPQPLTDGSPTRYAMGLMTSGAGSHSTITHGGGINGFLSDGRYYPEEDLTIIVLQNSTGPRGPGALGGALAELILGPTPELATTPFNGDLDDFLGEFSGPSRGRALTVSVTRDGDTLVVTPVGSSNPFRLLHLHDLTWGAGNNRFLFVRQAGQITELHFDHGSGHYVLTKEGE